MEILGVKFAPLHVPTKRRLQTLSAAAWFVLMAFGSFIGSLTALYLILFTRFWWATLLYLGWVYLDLDISEKGGRKIEWVRDWEWWTYFRDYFPLRLERMPWIELDPKKNYLFCCFPHGMLSCGAFNAFATSIGEFRDYFPYHTPHVLTLSQHFKAPFFRELALALGGCSASAKSIIHLMTKKEGGNVACLMVGGAQEAYYCKPNTYKLVLNKRKGFVKLAFKTGCSLVPVISFGETDLYTQIDGGEGSKFRQFQEKVRHHVGMAPVVPLGRGFFQYSFGIIPQRRPVTTLVGKPIDIPQIDNPSTEQIEELHSRFVKQLTEMFEEQKCNYLKDPENIKLEIE